MNHKLIAMEISKEIERIRKEEPTYDINGYQVDDAKIDKLKAKLQAYKDCWKEELLFLQTLKSGKSKSEPPSKELFEKIVKERTNCQICGKGEHNLDLHHIIPRRYKGGNSEDNLLLICENCHRIIEDMLHKGSIENRKLMIERISSIKKALNILEKQ